VSAWYEQVGDVYLADTELGDSLQAARAIHDKHTQFEFQARVRYASLIIGERGTVPGRASTHIIYSAISGC
jgi:hypothetical protein